MLDAADWLPHKSILHLAHDKMEEKVLRPLWKQQIADFQRSTTALMPSPCGGRKIYGFSSVNILQNSYYTQPKNIDKI